MNESIMGLKLAVKGFKWKATTIFWKLEEKKHLVCSSRKSTDPITWGTMQNRKYTSWFQ